MLYDLLWDIRQSLRTRGFAGSFRAARRRLFPPRVTPNPFDSAHGTDTGGLLRTQRGEHPNVAHSRDYWGTPPSLLRGALDRWSATLPGTGHILSDYTFIDLGCGKGRALMLASEYPFAAVVGVELNPALVRVAQANLTLWGRTTHACNNLQVLHEDALAFPLPDAPALLYLFNPFDAHVIGRLADRIADALPTRHHLLDILYARPEHSRSFEGLPGVQVLWRGELPLAPEDMAADIFESTGQECSLYRLLPPTMQNTA